MAPMMLSMKNTIKRIANYINGNTRIRLFNDGTRIMETDDDSFDLQYPTNIDMTITHKCDNGCPYCYLGCSESGNHAEILKVPFYDTLLKGSELAVNLNNCDHPQLEEFLVQMKNRGIFVNGTVNQVDFMRNIDLLRRWRDEEKIWGLGISLKKPDKEFLELVDEFPNAVIQVINGILSPSDIEGLRDRGLKILILGYKKTGRGWRYEYDNYGQVEARMRYLKDVLPIMFHHFKVISFDNLAIEQLGVKNMGIVTDDEWGKQYQGDDGTCTFAIDLVTGTFSKTSMDDVKLPVIDDVAEMFHIIKTI